MKLCVLKGEDFEMKKEFDISKAGVFLTVSEISAYLNVSKSQAYELTHRRDFPVTHIGGSIRIPTDAFLTWIKLQTTMPKEIAKLMEAAA